MSRRDTPYESSQDAEIYREAARLLEANDPKGSKYSCDRIGEALGVWDYPRPKDVDSVRRHYSGLRDAYAALFKPEHSDSYWGREWGDDAHDCRILALCMMAAITERP